MNPVDPKPYGYKVVFQRAKANGGMQPEIEQVTIQRKGTERAARRAACLTSGFREIVEVIPISHEVAPAPRVPHGPSEPVDAEPADRGAGHALTPDQAEEAAGAVQAVRRSFDEMASLAAQKRKLLAQVRDGLEVIERLLPQGGGEMSDAAKLLQRCDRLSELFNIEELESWKITVDRAMEEAWRRLP